MYYDRKFSSFPKYFVENVLFFFTREPPCWECGWFLWGSVSSLDGIVLYIFGLYFLSLLDLSHLKPPENQSQGVRQGRSFVVFLFVCVNNLLLVFLFVLIIYCSDGHLYVKIRLEFYTYSCVDCLRTRVSGCLSMKIMSWRSRSKGNQNLGNVLKIKVTKSREV